VIAPVMAALAVFERDLIRERIKSRIAAAKARAKRLGRQPGQRLSDRKATKVLKLADAGLSYRLIGRHVGLSKTRSEQSCNARVRRTNESKCNRSEDRDCLE
jgi:DNA invertase Pin-like site-specific DNA recombinase